MKYLVILLLLVSCSTPEQQQKKKGLDFDCLTTETAKCPRGYLNHPGPFTDRDKEIFACRMKAMSTCTNP